MISQRVYEEDVKAIQANPVNGWILFELNSGQEISFFCSSQILAEDIRSFGFEYFDYTSDGLLFQMKAQ